MPATHETSCFICLGPAKTDGGDDSVGHTHFLFRCPRCGTYRVDESLRLTPYRPDKLVPYLSAATRQAFNAGGCLALTSQNLAELAEPHRSISISRKIDNFLKFLAAACKLPGTTYRVDFNTLFPALDCATPLELLEYAQHLEQKGLVSRSTNDYKPTIEGWQLIEPTLTPGGEPDRCFVAMWFADEMDEGYELGFEKAITLSGFKSYRVKGDPTNRAVIDKILAEIRRAHFTVADFTGARQSVYYEAGFALGLGREVIGCCRQDWIDRLAFDTRHLGHVVWSDPADLAEKLANSIQALILPKR